jgi:hypothetical protein
MLPPVSLKTKGALCLASHPLAIVQTRAALHEETAATVRISHSASCCTAHNHTAVVQHTITQLLYSTQSHSCCTAHNHTAVLQHTITRPIVTYLLSCRCERCFSTSCITSSKWRCTCAAGSSTCTQKGDLYNF